MAAYDFKSLSPDDFERLCHDLLEHDLGVKLQSFAIGKDQGIDLRHAPVLSKTWIVQCKHYANSTYPVLLSHLTSKELPKVRKLKPDRYIFATSVPLTPQRVDELYNLFSPYCRSKHDIYGCDDLNNLLRQHPDIEEACFKLWLTSKAVLTRVLQRATFIRSEFRRGQLQHRLRLFVHTPAAQQVRRMLEEQHVCVISGSPGIGKSTLAEIVLVRYAEAGWDLVEIQQNVSEAMNVYWSDAAGRQLFYYDDFLGQVTMGDKLAKNEERDIQQLITAVRKSRNKRFLLTTREYILAQAKEQHEALRRADIDVNKIVLSLGDYNELDKARILLNHLYFADVSQEHINAILDTKAYLAIINHRNYTPRLIESMTTPNKCRVCSAHDYPGAFLHFLDNPTEIWDHPFRNQLRTLSRQLLLWLVVAPSELYLEDLRRIVLESDEPAKVAVGVNVIEFQRSLNELEGDFIRIQKYHSGTCIAFRNPSVLDYLASYLGDNSSEIATLIAVTPAFEVIERLVALFSGRDSDKGAQGTLAPYGAILRQAFARTLHAEPLTLMPVGHGVRVDRCKVRLDLCARLKLGLALATAYGDDEWHELMLRSVEDFVTSLSSVRPWITSLRTLFTELEKLTWIGAACRTKWATLVKNYVVADVTAIDEAEAAAQWIDEHRGIASADEIEAFRESLFGFVLEEVEQLIADETDMRKLEELQDSVGVIGVCLHVDVSSCFRSIDDCLKRIQKSGPFDGDDDYSDHPVHAGSMAQSVADLLESLRA